MALKFEQTISVGNMMQMLILIVVVTTAYVNLQAQQTIEAQRLSAVEERSAASAQRIRVNEIQLAGQNSDLRNIIAGVKDIKAALDRLAEKGVPK